MHIILIYKLITEARGFNLIRKSTNVPKKENQNLFGFFKFFSKIGTSPLHQKLHNVLIMGIKALKSKHISYTTIKPR